MADRKSIFSDDWRDCLEAHYKDVVRRDDKLTEDTLVGVLHDVGFRDADLQQLKLEATMRAEDMQGDFVPELDVDGMDDDTSTTHMGVDVPTAETPLEEVIPPHEVEPDPDDNFLPEDVAVVEEPEGEEAPAEAPEDDETPDEPDPNAPQQMSMF